MKTFLGAEICEREIVHLLDEIKKAGVLDMTQNKLMDNLSQSGDVKDSWDVRISMVSAKDLPSHNNSKYTDGNHNGKTLVIPFLAPLISTQSKSDFN